MSSTFEEWKAFFIAADFAEENAIKYASTFVREEMSLNTLSVINTGVLKNLKVSKVGHQMAILQHIKNIEKSKQSTAAETSCEENLMNSPVKTSPTKASSKSKMEEFKVVVENCKGDFALLVLGASSIITNLEDNLANVMEEQKLTRCLFIFRQKIEVLEARFSLTSDLAVNEMQLKIHSYVKKYKSEASEAIMKKLEALESERRAEILNFFSQDTIKNLSNEMFSKWKDGIKSKIEECEAISETVKEQLSKLIGETNMQLDHLSIVDQFPVYYNARFTRWMYYLIFSTDKRAKEINDAVAADADMNLFSFCASVAELYTTSSKVFHPGSKIKYNHKMSFDDIMKTLEDDLEMDDDDVLKSAGILLKAGSKKLKMKSSM